MGSHTEKSAVYVFQDERYLRGVKVGKGFVINCLHDANGYSPGKIFCAGSWFFENSKESSIAEKAFHNHLISQNILNLALPTHAYPRNGTEWFDATADVALTIGDQFFGRPHKVIQIDGTRQDKVLSTPEREGRLILWVFQECGTNRIKISTCSEFRSPTAQRRRYSRNGYEEVAAFSIDAPFTLVGNQKVFQARLNTIRVFGAAPNKAQSGWLCDKTQLDEVLYHLSKIEILKQIDDIENRPAGTRPSYTGKGCHVPAEELTLFIAPWWD